MFESYSGSSEAIPYSRQYSICLRPSVIPALGPLITGLIASGVARYSGFKLLDSVNVYTKDGTVKSVPGSKEAVFNAKDISLIEKRRLMRFLTFAASEFEDKPEIQGKEGHPVKDFLKSTYQLSDDTITVIVYSLAHCVSAKDPTLPALLRLRGYVRGVGRYGPSPFLVGHYGGLGDISQGFCVYVLGRPIVSTVFRSEVSTDAGGDSYIEVKLDDFPETHLWHRIPVPSPPSVTQAPTIAKVARCVTILDTPLQFQPRPASSVFDEGGEQESDAPSSTGGPLDTAVLIIPPSTYTAATVFINGENSLSTPKGRWIVYIVLPLTSTQPDQTAESVLKPYLDAVLSFAQTVEGAPTTPLSTSFFFEKQLPAEVPGSQAAQDTPRYIIAPPLTYSAFPDIPDAATYSAEATFQQAIRSLRALKGDPVRDDEDIDFWPPMAVEEENSDDDS
ncbi:hypothetical protein FA13DRAFT_1728294 [Coprinellus micaceus]|uniref:Rab proteins geranylgeranyltransferase n=1 Tax=Coprinellus micaceus TaxID=71717 RepID=A0A4Y7TMR3_COPMI|nr:hypothetical protein FA13DRAFT_1728294 [Coprinellus micaceus]